MLAAARALWHVPARTTNYFQNIRLWILWVNAAQCTLLSKCSTQFNHPMRAAHLDLLELLQGDGLERQKLGLAKYLSQRSLL
jgi:hypothetical protein